MVKNLITASLIVLSLTAFRPVSAQRVKHNDPVASRTEVKFLDDIQVGFSGTAANAILLEKDPKLPNTDAANSKAPVNTLADNASAIENVTTLQLKYGILMNTEVEQIKNATLYQAIDEWYGTPYRLGGSTKNGVDCSAFVQAIYTALFGILIPRTAHEQYQASRQINREALQEGDLVFFNTTGGVSHVGIYLQNNKFVHAGVSEGVTISDLDDSYWSRRFIGAAHYDMAPSTTPANATALSVSKP